MIVPAAAAAIAIPFALAAPAARSLVFQHDSYIPVAKPDIISQTSYDWSMDLNELRLVQFGEDELATYLKLCRKNLGQSWKAPIISWQWM